MGASDGLDTCGVVRGADRSLVDLGAIEGVSTGVFVRSSSSSPMKCWYATGSDNSNATIILSMSSPEIVAISITNSGQFVSGSVTETGVRSDPER